LNVLEGPALSTPSRPDLEEFLSALNGFLSKQTTPSDPSYIRFLEIFFRSVKASKGHILKITDGGVLESVISYGLEEEFDQEFNKAHLINSGDPCPLDRAFQKEEPVAIVDLTKDASIPPWFQRLMKRYGFSSLVAVPLMGAQSPVGILCAYYDDICLFDQATLGHLMMIGRMVGGATEQSMVANKAESHVEKEKVIDQFLGTVNSSSLNQLQIYELIVKLVSQSISLTGMLSGPIRKVEQGVDLMLAAGKGVYAPAISRHFILPPFILRQIPKEESAASSLTVKQEEWGSLQSLIPGKTAQVLIRGMYWKNQLDGVIVAWKIPGPPFEKDDDLVLKRIASLASLALRIRQ